MDGFFLEYRDPLFSLIVFFFLIFMVTFIAYLWGRYKRKEDYKNLNKFLQQFQVTSQEDPLSSQIKDGVLSRNLWLMLADAYFKNGAYEKAIEIYHELLHMQGQKDLQNIMFLLGKTYFKAGFLERSKQTFLELLHYAPRNAKALHYLLLVYEYMKEYKHALEVLEPLDELQEDIMLEKEYLNVRILLDNPKIDVEKKVSELAKIYRNSQKLVYMIFEYIFRVDPKKGWELLNLEDAIYIIDILWNLERNDINFDIIANDDFLQQLYTAKGYIKSVQHSDILELDILIQLQEKDIANLSFSYTCSSCKTVAPFPFYRCSSCHNIATIDVEYMLCKNYFRGMSEENNSFQ